MQEEKTILIVDDEEVNRKGLIDFLKKVFKEPDYHFLEAEDGDVALKIFKSRKIDLILTDFNMPFRGDQLAKSVHEINPEVPVIVVTFAFMPDCKEWGFDALVEKPINVGTLIRTIIRCAGFKPRG